MIRCVRCLGSDPQHRLFVAVPLPAELELALSSFLDRIAGIAGVRPTLRPNLHLTAYFIGSVQAELTPVILSNVERIALELQAFALSPRIFEFRGKATHPSMIWLAFEQSVDFLKLHDRLRLALATFQTTGNSIQQPVPHITLARIRGGHDVRSEVVLPDQLPAALKVDRIGLWRTHSTPSGVRYERLSESRLRE